HVRKALLVAFHFPPDAAVGAIRPAKTVKHLSRLGWEVHVVTVRERYMRGTDHGSLEDVAGTRIIRTAVWPTLPQLALRLRHWIWRRSVNETCGSLPPPALPNGGGAGQDAVDREPLGARAKRYVAALCELPEQM